MQSKIILGIDPGTVVMGYGLINCAGDHLSLVEMGVLRLPTQKDSYERLRLIHQKVHELIGRFSPGDFAIEAPFFGKNVQSMLKLGRAQGVAMAAALSRNVTITEYSPRKIKQSITGNGNATKEQVAAMLQTLLKFKETPEFLDATDGLAVAVCHSFQKISTGRGNKISYSGWEAFVKENNQRVASPLKVKK